MSLCRSFVPAELVNQMLQIGKSINFIRVCCDDKEWVMEGAAALLEGGNVQFGDNERLLVCGWLPSFVTLLPPLTHSITNSHTPSLCYRK